MNPEVQCPMSRQRTKPLDWPPDLNWGKQTLDIGLLPGNLIGGGFTAANAVRDAKSCISIAGQH